LFVEQQKQLEELCKELVVYKVVTFYRIKSHLSQRVVVLTMLEIRRTFLLI